MTGVRRPELGGIPGKVGEQQVELDVGRTSPDAEEAGVDRRHAPAGVLVRPGGGKGCGSRGVDVAPRRGVLGLCDERLRVDERHGLGLGLNGRDVCRLEGRTKGPGVRDLEPGQLGMPAPPLIGRLDGEGTTGGLDRIRLASRPPGR